MIFYYNFINYKISYLAENCGFSSHSSFATVFKSITGISPVKFIELLNQELSPVKVWGFRQYHSNFLPDENNFKTVAFPSISTGIYGYPVSDAAAVAMKSIQAFCDAEPKALRRITMVLFDGETYKAYQKALFTTFPEAEGDAT